MLIMLSLLPLIVLTFLSVMFGNDFLSATVESGWITDDASVFEIDPFIGMIAILLIIAIFSLVIGFNILASGFSDTGVKALSTGLLYTGLWAVLSVLAFPLFKDIKVFGTLIYVALTIIYVIGVIEKMYGGGRL